MTACLLIISLSVELLSLCWHTQKNYKNPSAQWHYEALTETKLPLDSSKLISPLETLIPILQLQNKQHNTILISHSHNEFLKPLQFCNNIVELNLLPLDEAQDILIFYLTVGNYELDKAIR